MNLLLVFNPQAGGGRAERLVADVTAALQKFASVESHPTGAPGDATRDLATADLDGFDGVIAAGGDGTLFEVVNGLCMRHGDVPPLGVLPIGTGNAFARDLGLRPGDWAGGVDLVRAGHTRLMDIGRVEDGQGHYHFINIVGAGLPVAAMLTAERLKTLGRSAYSVAALWQALRGRHERFELELDGDRIAFEGLFMEAANTRYTGTSFLIAPDARPDDGLLDVVMVRRLPRRRVLRLFPTIYSGRHVDYPEVEIRQASEVRIAAPGGLPLTPDGELRGVTPAVVRCLPRRLAVFADRESA